VETQNPDSVNPKIESLETANRENVKTQNLDSVNANPANQELENVETQNPETENQEQQNPESSFHVLPLAVTSGVILVSRIAVVLAKRQNLDSRNPEPRNETGFASLLGYSAVPNRHPLNQEQENLETQNLGSTMRLASPVSLAILLRRLTTH